MYEIGRWLATGHVGASSTTLAAAILGYVAHDREPNFPRDSDDFGRCAKLWLQVGDDRAREGLTHLAAISGPWNRLMEKWDDALDAWCRADHTACNQIVKACVDQSSGIFVIRKGDDGRWDRFKEQL